MYNTIRQAYVAILMELLKEESPSLYIEDFLYYYNKAISEYMKLRYEKFEITQQLTDDVRAWKKSFTTDQLVTPVDIIGHEDGYSYRHLLSCVVTVKLLRPSSKCAQKVGTESSHKVTRMTSTIKAGIINNAYLKAAFYRPYFDILDNVLTIDVGDINPRDLEISNITVEYLKQPENVVLTEEQIRAEQDTSQVLEFAQDVYDEVNKVALKLLLERGSNQRLQSHVAVNQSVNDISIGGGGK